jgi:cell division septum initiation protein DivIVA
MSAPDRFQRPPPLRYRRFGGGYRREDVEFALAELRLTLRQLENDLQLLRDRNGDLEDELRNARNEIAGFRGKEHELSQTMASVLRRAAEIEEGANARAREIVARADEAAMRIRSEASRRIEDSSVQFNELLRLKDNLLHAMRAVVGDFDQAISRVERGEQLFPGAMQAAPG